jgi:hypothetical protein
MGCEFTARGHAAATAQTTSVRGTVNIQPWDVNIQPWDVNLQPEVMPLPPQHEPLLFAALRCVTHLAGIVNALRYTLSTPEHKPLLFAALGGRSNDGQRRVWVWV